MFYDPRLSLEFAVAEFAGRFPTLEAQTKGLETKTVPAVRVRYRMGSGVSNGQGYGAYVQGAGLGIEDWGLGTSNESLTTLSRTLA